MKRTLLILLVLFTTNLFSQTAQVNPDYHRELDYRLNETADSLFIESQIGIRKVRVIHSESQLAWEVDIDGTHVVMPLQDFKRGRSTVAVHKKNGWIHAIGVSISNELSGEREVEKVTVESDTKELWTLAKEMEEDNSLKELYDDKILKYIYKERIIQNFGSRTNIGYTTEEGANIKITKNKIDLTTITGHKNTLVVYAVYDGGLKKLVYKTN